jgi:hypothetical protein
MKYPNTGERIEKTYAPVTLGQPKHHTEKLVSK